MKAVQINTKKGNPEAILKLARFIASEKLPFDMGEATCAVKATDGDCGTPGCVGGTAAALWPKVREEHCLTWNDEKLATFLKLDPLTHDAMCSPGVGYSGNGMTFADTGEKITYTGITRAGAVAMLKRLAKTNIVLWLKSEQV